MKKLAITIAAVALCSGTVMAADAASSKTSSKLSNNACANLWHQANPSGAKGITESQASQYIADFKSANPDGDATIEHSEWVAACKKGLVHASMSSGSSSGASSGEAGKPNPETHAPTNRMNSAVPEMVPPKKN